jgi:pimeloyl-ACP methyl ester carboxylesterase
MPAIEFGHEQRPFRPASSFALAVMLALSAISCSSGQSTAPPLTATPSASQLSPTSAPTNTTAPTDTTTIEGMFDVGGHDLYLHCRGDGSPTVVYMHGSITDDRIVPHRNGQFALDALGDEVRVCVYDRRNVGLSDTVDAPQTPDDVVSDLRTLLDVAGVEPPYVLLGASFGGLVAYLYANQFPDEVGGMLLLDSMFPDEFTLDSLFPPGDRYQAFDKEDEERSLERISHYKMLVTAQRYIGDEPAIPVTYLSSIPEGFDRNDFGIEEYDSQVLDLQKAYVERFGPGRYVRVESPHFMEAAVPGLIVEELRGVLAAAR